MRLQKPPAECPNGEACIHLAQEKTAWHLDKSVSVGHLVSTAVAIAAFVGWAMHQENRVTKIEERVAVAIQNNVEQTDERKALKEELRAELREIRAILEQLRDRRR